MEYKHCHFSLVYNELPYLKQKLPFLYEHFDQLIFHDLSTFDGKFNFSNDGGHEFIKNYPDPENKITLIELRHGIQFVNHLGGPTNQIKLRMAANANQYIRDDIDVFWCTDMDEFFTTNLIKEVEHLMDTTDAQSIANDHYLFWNNFDTIMCESVDKPLYKWGLSRIARHKPGRQYSHCDLQTRHTPNIRAQNPIYHFCSVDKEKTMNKLYNFYKGTPDNYKAIWEKYENMELEPGKLYGYPDMHHSIPNMGIMKYPGNLKEELPYL